MPQAQIDAMNSKFHLTIGGHRREIVANAKRCALIGKTPTYETRGPMPESDPLGMGVVVNMLWKIRTKKGRLQGWVQFDTIRHGRSTYTKTYQSSPRGILEGGICPRYRQDQAHQLLHLIKVDAGFVVRHEELHGVRH